MGRGIGSKSLIVHPFCVMLLLLQQRGATAFIARAPLRRTNTAAAAAAAAAAASAVRAFSSRTPPLRTTVGGAPRRWLAASAYRGPMQAFVEEAVAEEFAPEHLEVLNESHGRAEDESHFKVVVVSDRFEGQRPLQRHRAVNAAIVKRSPTEDGALPFHSLTIVAKTPAQWSEDASVPDSPQCAGGDGSGLLR
jgi:stress-induced morphogen